MILCTKVCHKDYPAALLHIRSLKENKEKSKGRKFGAYYCAFHNAYHITSHANNSNTKFIKFKDK